MSASFEPTTPYEHAAILRERREFGQSQVHQSLVNQTTEAARKILEELPNTQDPLVLQRKQYPNRLFRTVLYDPALKEENLFVLLTKTKQAGDLKLYGGQKAIKFAFDSKGKKYVLGVYRKNQGKYEKHWEHATSEIQMMNRLKGIPEVVQLVSSVQLEEKKYLLMEFCDGGDLCQAIFSGVIEQKPLKERALLLRQLFLAMKQVHGREVLHRDIKSENFFIDQDKIKIGDFGLACLKDEEEAKKEIRGTPANLAPEQLLAMGNPDGLSLATTEAGDMWGLGIILYQFITKTNVPWEQEYDDEYNRKLAQIRPEYQEQHKAGIANKATANMLKKLIKPETAAKAQSIVQSAAYPDELKKLAFDLLSFKPDERPEAAKALERIDEYLKRAGFIQENEEKS